MKCGPLLFLRVAMQTALIFASCCFVVDMVGLISGVSIFFQKVRGNKAAGCSTHPQVRHVGDIGKEGCESESS